MKASFPLTLGLLILLPSAATLANAGSFGVPVERKFAAAEVTLSEVQKTDSELARLKVEIQKLNEAYEKNSHQYEESLTTFVYLTTHVTNPPRYSSFVRPAAKAAEESRVALEIARASIKVLEEKAGETGSSAKPAETSVRPLKGRPSYGERETGMDMGESSDF